MQEDQPLQVARCTKIIDKGSEDAKYIINVKQIAKFVVALADKVSPTDIEEGMRVGYALFLSKNLSTTFCHFSHICSVDKNKYQIQIALRPKIDPTVTLMQVEEKPDVTYEQVGGMTEELDQLREVCWRKTLKISSLTS